MLLLLYTIFVSFYKLLIFFKDDFVFSTKLILLNNTLYFHEKPFPDPVKIQAIVIFRSGAYNIHIFCVRYFFKSIEICFKLAYSMVYLYQTSTKNHISCMILPCFKQKKGDLVNYSLKLLV